MNVINWIHISDLHFGDNTEVGKQSRQSLLDYLSGMDDIKIDYLFITGDIIFAKSKTEKDKKKAYGEAKEYIKKLYAILWDEEYTKDSFSKRVFIVPGNHDVRRDQARESVISSMIENYKNNKQGIIEDSFLENSKNALDNYKCFYKGLYGNEKGSALHYVKQTDKINVLHICSTISSGKDEEEGKLIIGYDLLSNAMNKLDKTKPTIALSHHSISALDWDEQKQIELLLKENKVLLLLCGHSHERESSLLLMANQKRMLNIFTSGTLMADKGKSIVDTVFLYGKMDLETAEGEVASYKWDTTNGWHEDKEFGLVQGTKQENKRSFSGGDFDLQRNLFFAEDDKMQGVVSTIVGHMSGERQKAFIEINDKVRDSLSVYGIGITHVSKDKDLIRKVINNGGTVRLCMVNPDIFTYEVPCSTHNCKVKDMNFCIFSAHMDDYIRDAYVDDVINSYKRIMKMKKEMNSNNLKIRVLQSFVPISINIANETNPEQAAVIIEYNMPFEEKRLLIKLNRRENEKYYSTILNAYNKIWENAIEV